MSEQICNSILKLIRSYDYPVGASFLSAKLNLPQATIGRNLLALEQNGYLEKVSNKGRIMTLRGRQYLTDHEKLADKLDAAKCIIETAESNSKHKLCEILQIRIALESLSARQACLYINEQALAQLRVITCNHQKQLMQGKLGSEEDLQFHMKISELSNNQTLAQVLRLLLTQENAYTKFSMVAPHITDVQIKQHTDIVDAIASADAPRAQKAMTVHLKQVINDVLNYYTD